MSEQFLTYKGKPLVRKGNTVYYGDMSEKYIVRFEILSKYHLYEFCVLVYPRVRRKHPADQ